jgi:hypothetical protein
MYVQPPASGIFTGRGICNTEGQGRDYPPDWSPGVCIGFGLRTAVRALASRVIARSIGTFGCAVGWVAVVRIWPRGHRQLTRHERRSVAPIRSRRAGGRWRRQPRGCLRKRDARPARGVAQRAVGLVNGFVTTEFNDGSMSGQLGDDRSERISGVGADNEVGEAAVLPPPQDLLGGRRRVAREYQERVRRA